MPSQVSDKARWETASRVVRMCGTGYDDIAVNACVADRYKVDEDCLRVRCNLTLMLIISRFCVHVLCELPICTWQFSENFLFVGGALLMS